MSLGVLEVDMRQLDTCDFCGEQPEGVYEAVPDSLGGGPQRLALCASCRETLQSIVDPLLDAADGDASTESSPDAASGSTTQTEQPAGSTDTAADTAADKQTETERSSSASRSEQPDVSMPNDAESTAAATTDESAVSKPDGYAQVLRLLQNRDEAMPREDLRALATNAYDLGDRTFEEAVDAAIENSDVEETADGLRTQ